MKAFDAKHAAENGYTEADWAAVDSPELSDVELDRMTSFEAAFPKMAQKMRQEIKRRGRPLSECRKEAVSIRLDADLLKVLRASGKGWQSRTNDILREAFGL
jgi:uncharacterized protein (DUF4415 family)